MVRFLYITWSAYGERVSSLARKVLSSHKKFDLVVGVARGGIPVAMFVADRLGVKIDIINVKSYLGVGKRLQPKIVSTLTEAVQGKNVLVVDDLVDEGETMATIISYLNSERPRQINTAVLFKKPWSKFKPDFYLETLDKWVVFPWEHGEVKRLKAAGKSIENSVP